MTQSAGRWSTSPQPNVHSSRMLVRASGPGLRERRILDERRRGIERRVDGQHRRQLFVVDANQRRRVLGRVHAFRPQRRRPARRRTSFRRRPAPADRRRRAVARHRAAAGRRAVRMQRTPAMLAARAASTPRMRGARAGQVHELDVEDVVEPDDRRRSAARR